MEQHSQLNKYRRKRHKIMWRKIKKIVVVDHSFALGMFKQSIYNQTMLLFTKSSD